MKNLSFGNTKSKNHTSIMKPICSVLNCYKNTVTHYAYSICLLKNILTGSNKFWQCSISFESSQIFLTMVKIDIFIFKYICSAHWDFLPKFLSLHYYTTLEGVLCVQRRGQGQGTRICLLGPLFFRQNGMPFKKPIKIIKIQ